MPAVGRIEITRQAGSLAVLADVDVFHRTVNTVETSANDVLLATTYTSGKNESKHWRERPT
jgi:hypothetical protein